MPYDPITNERARRALNHGGGIDGILFMLVAAAGVVTIVVFLVFGLSAAESQAEKDLKNKRATTSERSPEFGVEK